jgi:tRNA-splicing ligase RtcB
MKGIEFNNKDAFLDEIPQAYKDIKVVMEDSKDLISIVYQLNQLVNVKGD